MKTTIEANGYEITVVENEEGITVTATKDGETVEEFSLETEAQDGDDNGSAQADTEDLVPFKADEEDDFEDGDFDDDAQGDDVQDDEPKLESFQTFIKNRK